MVRITIMPAIASRLVRVAGLSVFLVGGLPSYLLGIPPIAPLAAAPAELGEWKAEFPNTDFTRASIGLNEIVTDGPRRDTIPPIHHPKFIAVTDATDIGRLEPVVSIAVAGDARAYPLRILLWHEIVNDVVGGVPILVSYCPLCSSAVVFDRRLGDQVLTFGNTGRIRHYDMVMYDHQTESWWQQFLGQAIVGDLTGTSLTPLPARLESVEKFRDREPNGKLLIPSDPRARRYGLTPFAGMEAKAERFNFPYPLPAGIALERVVVVGDDAWTVAAIRAAGEIRHRDLILSWQAGQNSLHDSRVISDGRDVGNVVVLRTRAGQRELAVYDVTFAFAFVAFRPQGVLHVN